MDARILEAHIRQYIEAQTGKEVTFTWQGGEPTLMGLDFFRKVVELQKKYAKPNQSIYNDLQTNGLLLDDDWCRFLKNHDFLVGISIDGPQELHDYARKTKNQKSTYDHVMRAIDLLHQHEIPFHALCVVNNHNARHPLAVYRFLRDQVRPRMIQFLSAVERVDHKSSAPGYMLHEPATTPTAAQVTPWSVGSEDWGTFLSTIWKEWIQRDYGKVFVDQFENVISQILGFGPQKCTTAPICGKALALEHNGDLYSCDHFVYPPYKLGNIFNTHEGDLVFSKKQHEFAYAKHKQLPEFCKKCSYLDLCWGECPKNRFITTPENTPGLNYLCAGLKIFFQTATSNAEWLRVRIQPSST